MLDALLAGVYLSLHTSDPGDTGAGEMVGNGYTRKAVTFTQSGSNPTTAANDALIQFNTATAPWGTLNYFGIWSAATGGDFLGGAAVDNPKPVETDDVVRWLAGSLVVEAE
ncbi:head protein [Ochrobactrum phage vB_OspP_OH]|uniref:Tail protein n=1 Tax=Ochrobactrum phage vB_OspP_OH TaxID=2712957 RepID=A0A6G6XXX7_9CAUD|nr:head protein [Ochrobactrum phage vB_OspP_OH]QIG66103.1 tail protein [Ochrobactrum phage vB_OspP_OH]